MTPAQQTAITQVRHEVAFFRASLRDRHPADEADEMQQLKARLLQDGHARAAVDAVFQEFEETDNA